MYTGFFLTIEGIDGIGKSSQLNLLTDRIKSTGTSVYVTKEPGDKFLGSAIGQGVRDILFNKDFGTKQLGPGVGDLLFLADHVQNVHEIREYLQAGVTVVSDRYVDSQFAYSAHPSKKSPRWANKYFDEQRGLTPDLTILLMARGPHPCRPHPTEKEDIGWALDRANARRGHEAGKQDGKAWNDVDAQRAIQEAYFMNLRFEDRVTVVSVFENSTREQIHDEIWSAYQNAVQNRLTGNQFNLDLQKAA